MTDMTGLNMSVSVVSLALQVRLAFEDAKRREDSALALGKAQTASDPRAAQKTYSEGLIASGEREAYGRVLDMIGEIF